MIFSLHIYIYLVQNGGSTPSQHRSAAKILILCAVEIRAIINHNHRQSRGKKSPQPCEWIKFVICTKEKWFQHSAPAVGPRVGGNHKRRKFVAVRNTVHPGRILTPNRLSCPPLVSVSQCTANKFFPHKSIWLAPALWWVLELHTHSHLHHWGSWESD